MHFNPLLHWLSFRISKDLSLNFASLHKANPSELIHFSDPLKSSKNHRFSEDFIGSGS